MTHITNDPIIQEREKILRHVMHSMKQNALYAYPHTNSIFTKKGDKLLGEACDLNPMKEMVSADFFDLYFAEIE